MTTLTAKQIAGLVGVTPRSDWRPMLTVESVKERGFNEARYTAGHAISAAYQTVAEAAQMLAHLGGTGRLPYEATLALRETTPYRACKIIAAMAQTNMAGLIELERARVVSAIILREAQ
jgi:hypothetical protein